MMQHILFHAEETFFKVFSSQNRYRKTAEAMAAVDYYELQEVLESHLKRGYGYAEYQNWDDAVREFESVLSIHPHHCDGLYGLSFVYYNRWLDSGKVKDRFRAASLARRCVEADPTHHEALSLLSQIYKHVAFADSLKANSWHTNLLLVLVGVMFMSGGYFGYAFLEQQNQTEVLSNKRLEKALSPVLTSFEPDFSYLNTQEIESTVAVLGKNESHLPVEWIENPKFRGLQLEVEQSSFKSFEEAYSYNLLADLYVANGDVSYLQLHIEILDRDGQIITQDDIQAIEQDDPVARRGESIPFRYLEYQEQYVEEAALARVRVEKVSYQEHKDILSTPVELGWEDMSQFEPKLELAERVNNLQPTDQNGAFHYIEWELKNNSADEKYRLMQVEINWIGKNGDVLDSRTTYFINSSEPSLKSRQTRSIGRAYRLENVNANRIKAYTVTVKSLEE